MDIEKVFSELTLEEKASLCSGRDFWQTKAIDRLNIPSVMMCDGPHGLRKQEGEGDHLGINKSIETVCYPTASALASSFDREVLQKLGTALGKECQAENVAMLLGPGINMKRSPLCGRNFEYFSEDPYLAGELAAAYIQALQAQGVAACVKHFAANNQETRRMSGSSNLSERALRELYLTAFEIAVKKGKPRSIMCAYNAINGTFCSENKTLLTDILREEWGYDGFVVTDWGAVKDRVTGLKAGLDLEMPGGAGTQDDRIVAAVRDGSLDEAVLDQAVRNLLRFIEESADARDPEATIDREACSELSGEIEAECAVLLKNEGVLPLNQEDSVAFIGQFCAAPRYQGAGSSHINVPHAISALEAVRNAFAPGDLDADGGASDRHASHLGEDMERTSSKNLAAQGNVLYAPGYEVHDTEINDALLQEAVAAAKAVKTAVVFIGLPDSFETEGDDRVSLALPANQNALVEAVAEANPNTVVVYHGGSCAELPWISKVKAILCMYLGGSSVGTATVQLLYGKKNPSGKLAESWPLKLADNPSYLNFPGEDGVVEYHEDVFIGYRYYDKKQMDVLFPFGHGLSYSSFAYSDLMLDKTCMEDTDVLTVTCKVKNTGRYAGKEVVQLYVGEADGKETPSGQSMGGTKVQRPVRELKGFEKVSLAPGEEKTVTFHLDKRAFAYYETKIHDWFVESGRYQIEIGTSSRKICLSAAVDVQGTAELPVTFARYSTVGDIMKTAAGRKLIETIMIARRRQRGGADMEAAQVEAMGEGSERMMEKMMYEMSLNNLVTYGVMTFDQLDAMIDGLNSEKGEI